LPPVLGLTQPIPKIGEYEHFNWSDDIELEEDEDDTIDPDYAEGDNLTLLVDCAPRVNINPSRDLRTSRKSALDEDRKTSRDQSLPLMNGSERGSSSSSSSSNNNSNNSTDNDFDNNSADDSSPCTLGVYFINGKSVIYLTPMRRLHRRVRGHNKSRYSL
jgi:hypothetical protein